MTGSDLPGRARDRWHYRRSLASRVILLTTFAVGLAVAFVAVGAYITVRVQLQSTLDSSLTSRVQDAAQTPQLLSLVTSQDVGAAVLGAGDIRIGFVSADGTVSSTRGPSRLQLGKPELAVARGTSERSIRTLTAADGSNYRVVAAPTEADGERQALVLAQPLASNEQVLSRLGFVMLLFGIAGVLAASVAGWGVARNGLRPVRNLSAAAEEIARTEELTPLPVEGSDEIARLAASFNQVLTSLGASRDRQRQLVADAGHELRTPLTSLRTNIELLTQAGDGMLPPAARDELLADVRAQIEELTTLIGDLVELARDEPIARGVGPVELHETLVQALARVRRRAPGVSFDVEAHQWFLDGEQHAIERALTNLLDNAAKWSPPDGTIEVRLADGVVTVDDSGPGIAEDDLPHVFERFYRAEESRGMPGSGLGLAIVAQTAERHAGRVAAGRSHLGGARITFALPGSPFPLWADTLEAQGS
jgi:two-component system sensor histidine kinase MprB